MKRKVLWAVGIGSLVLVLIMGVARYIDVRNHQTDPNWQIANEIYKVENALKEVDEDYECQSVSAFKLLTYQVDLGNIRNQTRMSTVTRDALYR